MKNINNKFSELLDQKIKINLKDQFGSKLYGQTHYQLYKQINNKFDWQISIQLCFQLDDQLGDRLSKF